MLEHEAAADCGSLRGPLKRRATTRFFYWDDLPNHRLRPEVLTRDEALEQARAFARSERDKRS